LPSLGERYRRYRLPDAAAEAAMAVERQLVFPVSDN
jgi:hypothetical protein